MPVSMMRNGLTAENSIFSQSVQTRVSSSRFDLSRLNCFTSDIGMIVPVDLIPTLPGDSFDLGCQYKIDFRPMIVPTLTPYKVKVHYYYCPMEYLWHGWESFITKGRSGALQLSVPTVDLYSLAVNKIKESGLTSEQFKTADGSWYPLAPHSLSSYLVGSTPYYPDLSASADAAQYLYYPFIDGAYTLKETGMKPLKTNALPFLMYQKIFRSNYLDPNLYSNGTYENQVWFPDDIDSSDWRYDYAKANSGGAYGELFVPHGQQIPSSPITNFVPKAQLVDGDDGDNAVNILQLRYSMYSDDMFTTALPFLQRGPQTALDLSVVDSVINSSVNGADYVSAFGLDITASPSVSTGLYLALNTYDKSVGYLSSPNTSTAPSNTGFSITDSGTVKPVVLSSGLSVSSTLSGAKVNLTAEKLRSLLAVSVWQERNAFTNGSYGQFVKVHFDDYPNNQYCEPVYIGGTTSTFNVSSVIQQSATVDDQYLGEQAGIGGSSNQQSIGRFTAKDFGFIMALMTIIPDNVYVQSTEHWQFEINPDDYFMPEYEYLSLQAVLNKQLFVSGVDATDNDVFGYANRYIYLKQRDSIARGMFALPADVDAYYHSYVQSRQFADTPQLSQEFVTVYPPNIDRSFLAYPGQPCFLVQYWSSVNAVRKMSYVVQPNTFGF